MAWILGTIHKLGLQPPPQVAVMPLGTGNDLSLTFGWGNAFLDAWIKVACLALRLLCTAATALTGSSAALISVQGLTALGPESPGGCSWCRGDAGRVGSLSGVGVPVVLEVCMCSWHLSLPQRSSALVRGCRRVHAERLQDTALQDMQHFGVWQPVR